MTEKSFLQAVDRIKVVVWGPETDPSNIHDIAMGVLGAIWVAALCYGLVVTSSPSYQISSEEGLLRMIAVIIWAYQVVLAAFLPGLIGSGLWLLASSIRNLRIKKARAAPV